MSKPISGFRCIAILLVFVVAPSGVVTANPGADTPLPHAGEWKPGFWIADLDDNALSSVVFDDRSGPSLYVGGHFRHSSGVEVNGVARWDGSTWTPLDGPSDVGTNFYVEALAVFDDGSGPTLYAGGGFTTAGGIEVNHIAKWDGSAWSALSGPTGTGTQEWVGAMATFDDGSGPALYVGGWFTTAGGVAVNNIAKWDGSNWSALTGPSGTGTDDRVRDLVVYDDGDGPALYAGGLFTTAGGVAVNNIARWDGSSWSELAGALGTGTSGEIETFEIYDDGSGTALYAAGSFDSAGGVVVNNVARWDGAAWTALNGPSGTGTVGLVMSLAVFDDGSGARLFAGGALFVAGGVQADYIASWDGSNWSPLTGTSGSGVDYFVRTLCVFDDGNGEELIVGGAFRSADGMTANQIVSWDGSSWTQLNTISGNGVNSLVEAFEVFDDGSGSALYVGGWFRQAGDRTVHRIGRWDGADWTPLTGPAGTGVNAPVLDLVVHDDGSGPALYLGGVFFSAGGLDVDKIARWDGSTWTTPAGPSGTAMDGNVRTLATFDPGTGEQLYAGGNFSDAAGTVVNHIARWDGADWWPLTGPSATGTNGDVRAMTVFDDGSGPALYLGGDFTTAGGAPVGRVARWDGATFSALVGSSGNGVDGTVYALATYDDGTSPALYVGGSFITAGGQIANAIARWDGQDWTTVGAPPGAEAGITGAVLALHAYDDGFGDALYLGGWITEVGGEPARHLLRWDGASFSHLIGPGGEGVDDQVLALGSFDDGTGPSLFCGGYLHSADGHAAARVAEWDTGGILFTDGFESGDLSAWD